MKTHHFLNALLVSASALAALGQNQSVSNVAVSAMTTSVDAKANFD